MRDCIDKGLLVDFLESLTQEEINLMGNEFDLAIALEVEREEGREEGIEIGWEKGREEEKLESVRNLHEYGMTAEQIAGALKLPLEAVKQYLGK